MNREMSKDSKLSPKGDNQEIWNICRFFNSPSISNPKDCKECQTAQGIIESLNQTTVSAEYDGPGEDCCSNFYTISLKISRNRVIIKLTYSETDYYEEYTCVSTGEIVYALAHDPTNLFLSDEKKTHESVSFAKVNELEEEQLSPFYGVVDNDGFDYSSQKSATILLLEDIRDTLMMISFLKKYIPEKGVVSTVLSYVDHDKDFDLDNIRRMEIGDSI